MKELTELRGVIVVEMDIDTIRFPAARVGLLRVVAVQIRSRHVVRVYADRLAIHHGERLSWEDLNAIKRVIWGDDVTAVEVFPRQSEVINLRPTRHLWRSDAIEKIVSDISAGLHATHRSAQ